MYSNNYQRETYDPSRTASEAIDDRDERDGDLLEKAAWNDASDPVNHL